MTQLIDHATRHWWRERRLAWAPVPTPVDAGRTCSDAVREASLAIRLACFDEAEAILRSASADGPKCAAWLNLLGVVCESRQDFRRARQFYGKAMRCDRRFAPAEQNMRRWYEMSAFGRTRWPVALGDDRFAE